MPVADIEETVVEVRPAQSKTKQTDYKIVVAASSLEHAVSRVVVWDTVNQAPVHDTSAPGAAAPTKKNANHDWTIEFKIDTTKNDFPLVVDVHEAGDTTEHADIHRHGMFQKDGSAKFLKKGDPRNEKNSDGSPKHTQYEKPKDGGAPALDKNHQP